MRIFFIFLLCIVAAYFFVPECYTTKDSAELCAGAYVLGIIHPPGSVLYLLIAHAWQTFFFFCNPAHALNMLSFFCAMLTVWGGIQLLNTRNRAAYGVLVCLLASNFALVEYAVIAETDWMAAAFLIFAVLHLKKNRINTAVFLAALSAAVSVYSVFFLPLFFPAVFKLKRNGITVILLCILMITLYIPVRSSQNPPIKWYAADSVQGVADYVIGKDFRAVENALGEKNDKTINSVYYLFFNYFMMIFFAASFISAIARKEFLLCAAAILGALPVIFQGISFDVSYHYLIFPVLCVSIMSVNFIHITITCANKIHVWYAFFALSFVMMAKNVYELKKYPFYIAKNYAERFLQNVSDNSIVIIGRDCRANYFEYEAVVKKRKISVIDAGLLQYPWYLTQLKEKGYIFSGNNTEHILISIIKRSSDMVFIENDPFFEKIISECGMHKNTFNSSSAETLPVLFSGDHAETYYDIEGKNILTFYKNTALKKIQNAIRKKSEFDVMAADYLKKMKNRQWNTILKQFYFLYAGFLISSDRVEEAVIQWEKILQIDSGDKYAQKNIQIFKK